MPEEDVKVSPVENSPEPTGQDAVIDVSPEAGQEAEPYFSYDWGDGNVDTFKTKEDLSARYRDKALMRQNFSKKTDALARERETFTANKGKFDAEYTAFLTSKGEIDKYNTFLKQNPQAAAAIKREMTANKRSGNPQYTELDAKLKAQQEWIDSQEKEKKDGEQRAAESKAIDTAHNNLASRYPSYDKKLVSERLKALNEAPAGDETNTLLELLWLAEKGKTAPDKMQADILKTLERKEGINPPLTGGKHKSSETKYGSFGEAAAAAKHDAGLT